ncbi:leucine-rich repeat domain-containing protein [uncultured Fibrella sp.]|uniref:leucine-rich repeat domain-containing protein n=1 Tax=uncultured Fibrella sp. TaxID=1284596 RepID=UPI0035CB27C3
MQTRRLSLLIALFFSLAAHAQVTVLLRADTAKYGISPAQLDATYLPLSQLVSGMNEEQRAAMYKVRSEFDRSRYAFIESQGPLPGYGFSYVATEYVRANGAVEWVLISTNGIVSDKLLQELMGRLTAFYNKNNFPVAVSKPFQTMYRTSYGRPLIMEKRLVRTGDSTVSILEIARTTMRPDTVKYLHFNQLGLASVPEVVYRFPNLEELDLSKNKLTKLDARITADIPSLRRLNLLYNQIGNDSVFIAKKTDLRALTLQGNKLTHIPAAVRNCKKLESLWMGNNNLTELNIKPLRGLRRLNDLNLYNAGLTALPRQIRKLKHVTVLDLYYNQLTELPRQIGRMKRLEQLAVANNKLTALPAQLARLKKLNTLFVHHNKLSQLPDQFAKLASLRTLDIGYNQFSNVPDVLLRLGTLESVDISNNNLQTLPTSLIGLKNLKKFYIRSNPLTSNDAKSGPYAQLIEALETNKTEVFY